MNRIYVCLILLFFNSCTNNSQESLKQVDSTKKMVSTQVNLPLNPFESISYKEPYNPHSPYYLNLKIEKTNTLVLVITLKNDSYFISPHSKGDFPGRFNMSLDNNNPLQFFNDIIEIPHSVKKTNKDYTYKGKAKLVTTNTTYKQHFTVKTNKDFRATGKIRFVIEPRCSFEEIPFVIEQKSGKLSVNIIAGC